MGKKAKYIGDNSFKTQDTVDTFGAKITDHELLAKGAEVQEVETKSTPLDDQGGDGKPIILRRFSYQLPPKVKYSKADLLLHHKPRIQPFLWKDGLEEIAEPRVVLGKKGKFDIFVTCQARKGQLLHEKPLTLSEVTHAHGSN